MKQSQDFSSFICPACKGPLKQQVQADGVVQLYCAACSRVYPITANIPDFLATVMDQIHISLIQRVDRADKGYLRWASGLYESRLWYPLVIRLYLGKNTTSLADLINRVKAALNIEQGRVLDAACGSATYGRRVASPGRAVFGIDISMAMLQKGSELILRDQVANIHLARAQVECLPFSDQFFDFAICSGALHLFQKPVTALQEIGRTLKPGARLVVMTFINGQAGLLQYAWFRERLRKRGTIHVFELSELQMILEKTGFEHFQPKIMGSGIFFQVEKAAAASRW